MKGYIQLNLGGVSRGVKFGNRALIDIMSKYQVAGGGIQFSFDLIVDLVWFGLINNCMNKKENPDFTIEQVEEWVDDLDMPKLMEIFTVFEKSYSGEAAPGEEKPKVTKLNAAKKKVNDPANQFPTEEKLLEIVGELGVPLFDFYAMTWNEWCYYSNGLHKAKTKEWEHTRAITWMVYKANSDPKKSAKNMLSWWKLPTDNQTTKAAKPKGRRVSKAKLLEFFEKMK